MTRVARERTRRETLRDGVVLGGLAVAGTGVPLLSSVRNAFATADDDVSILAAAVALEQTAVLTYATAATSPELDAGTRLIAERFGLQEQEHADALTVALQGLGGRPPIEPTEVTEVSGLAEAAESRRGLVEFVIGLEMMALAAYYDAHLKLKDPALLHTGAQIMANEGQHLAVLRRAAGQDPVPNAFVTGQASP